MSDTPDTDALDEMQYQRDLAMKVIKRLEQERDEAQTKLTGIHRWIERNHADGFIDSLNFPQNLERVTDNWYDRIERVERERDELKKELLKCNEYNDELYRKLKQK
jgi:uncharacterized protein (UPF0335 family)